MDDLIGQGNRELESGDYRAACKTFRRADRSAAGGSTDALWGQGNACYQAERYELARGAAQRLANADLAPEEASKAHYLLAVSTYGKGKVSAASLEQAASALDRALELGLEESATAYYTRALILEEQGQANEALMSVRRSLQIEPAGSTEVVARTTLCRLRHALRKQGTPDPLDESEVAAAQYLETSTTDTPGSGSMQRPLPLHDPRPQTPPKGGRFELYQELAVSGVVDREGCLVGIVQEAGTAKMFDLWKPYFDTWAFRPATTEGKAIPVRMTFKRGGQ